MQSVVLSCALAFLLLGPGTEGQVGLGGQGGKVLQPCPQDWVSWRQFCYLFVNGSKVTWSQARSECLDRQAGLLRIETKDEYDFLRKAWESTTPSMIPVSDMYWTALNNLPMNQGAATKPVFMWGGDEFPLDSVVKNNWDKEPDNTLQKNCAMVNVQGTLAMSLCSDLRPYICEFQKAKGDACPTGWIIGYDNSYCYKVSNASDWTQWKSWAIARKVCESNPNRKTTLIKVTAKDVQNFLLERLPSVYDGRKGFWTGLNDLNHEGVFVWAGNGGTTMNVNNFDGMWRKEPDNLGGNEHCGALMPHGRWNDRSCVDNLNYACRMSLTTAPKEMNFGCGSWLRAGIKCVEVSNTLKTWDDARAFCKQGGGDLLSFTSQTDADWITLQAINSMAQRRHPGYWIGLNDRQTENKFVWSDGSQLQPALLNWDKEPNNNEFCSAMSDGGVFADYDCIHVHTGSICEEPIKNCAMGWTGYGGHCYRVNLNWLSRLEASTNCNATSASYQGRLFALNSVAEKNWILSILHLNRTTPHLFWSGLVNRAGWLWEYDDDNLNPNMTQQLVKWAEQPNNLGNQDCVEILANGRLNDANCSNSRAFICQKAAPGAAAPVGARAHISAIVLSILAPVLFRMLV